MKKVIRFLPAMAILLASGLAVATTSKTMAPQYYKNALGQWRSIAGDGVVFGTAPGQYTCADAPAEQCTAEGLDHLGVPFGIEPGIATQNP
jgi:hypothetical protein